MMMSLSPGFNLIAVKQLNDTQVTVKFNRAPTAGTSENAANYTVSNSAGNPVSAVLSGETVTLSFAAGKLLPGVDYIITIQNIQSITADFLINNIATASIDMLGTAVSGVITQNTTWDTSGSPYYITDDLKIQEEVTLTVKPGTVIKFLNKNSAPYYSVTSKVDLVVYGSLKIEGTVSDSVYITSADTQPAAGNWGAIYFDIAAQNNGCFIDYAYIEYGTQNIYSTISNFRVSHSTLTKASSYSVYCIGIDDGEISECKIINNNGSADCGIYLYSASLKIFRNYFYNNYYDIYLTYTSNPEIYSNLSDSAYYSIYIRISGYPSAPNIFSNTFNRTRGATLYFNGGACYTTIKNNNFTNNPSDFSSTLISGENDFVDVNYNYIDSINKTPPEAFLTNVMLSNFADTNGYAKDMSFKSDGSYGSNLTVLNSGDSLFIQLEYSDSDSANINNALVLAKSSATDTAGIYVKLVETGAATGIYRGTLKINVSSDTSKYWLGALNGETVTVYSVHNTSVNKSIVIGETGVPEIIIYSPSPTSYDTRVRIITVSGSTLNTNAGDTVYCYVNNILQHSNVLSISNQSFSGTAAITGYNDSLVMRLKSGGSSYYDTISVSYVNALVAGNWDIDTIYIEYINNYSGCTVSIIKLSDGSFVASTLTDTFGGYSFTDIESGVYYLQIKKYNSIQRLSNVFSIGADGKLNTHISFGSLKPGDADNNNKINKQS